MKTITPTTLAALVSLCLTGVPAHADLLQRDSPRFGANSLTLDTGTGLTWLDLPFTLDLSYLDAEAATQPGGKFTGFRHATAQEVQSLYGSAGFGEGLILQSSPSFQNVASLISLVGQSSAQDGAPEALGITGTLVNGHAVLAAMDYLLVNGTPGYLVSAVTGGAQYGLDTHFPTVGNWMVVVPEPSSYALLLVAGALMMVLPRRR